MIQINLTYYQVRLCNNSNESLFQLMGSPLSPVLHTVPWISAIPFGEYLGHRQSLYPQYLPKLIVGFD